METNLETLYKSLAVQNEVLMALMEKEGIKTKTPASTITATQLHGAAGIFGVAGLEPDIITAHVRPHGIYPRLPGPFATVYEDPRFGSITGFTDVVGDEPTNACEDAPAGFMKSCMLTARFGMIRRDTNTIEIQKVMRRLHRGDFTDLRLHGEVLGMTGLEPSGMNQDQILSVITASEMVNVGVQYERKMSQQIWQGSVLIANEFPGLDNQIQTGQMDADTGTLCPALDSDVKDYNYNALGADIVEYLSSMMFYLEYNAEHMGLDPVDWVICMRPGLWEELTEIWPCSYHTNRCAVQVETNASVTLDGRDNTRERDAMRQSMTLRIRGKSYPVVTDTGIYEHNSTNDANLIPGEYASTIYVVPLRIRGNFPTTYMEYMDYTKSMPDMNLLRNMPEFWHTDNGMFFWAYEGVKWCYKLSLLTEQRIVLRTPQLAGRLDHVKYTPMQHEREGDPNSDYFMDGGVSLRDLLSSPNAVWTSR